MLFGWSELDWEACPARKARRTHVVIMAGTSLTFVLISTSTGVSVLVASCRYDPEYEFHIYIYVHVCMRVCSAPHFVHQLPTMSQISSLPSQDAHPPPRAFRAVWTRRLYAQQQCTSPTVEFTGYVNKWYEANAKASRRNKSKFCIIGNQTMQRLTLHVCSDWRDNTCSPLQSTVSY